MLAMYPGPVPSMCQTQHEGEEFDALGHSDLLEAAKFYQDAVVEYQSAYCSIQDKYTHQACLLEEASGALWATESQASQTQQELLTLKRSCNADIQQAVSRAVSGISNDNSLPAQTWHLWTSVSYTAIVRSSPYTWVVIGKSSRSAFHG